MPHFIALVVVCGMIISFTTSNGFLTDLVVFLGGKRQNILANPSYFYPIFYRESGRILVGILLFIWRHYLVLIRNNTRRQG